MTPYEEIYSLFFDKIVNDIDFFDYNTTEAEALTIAKQRSKGYLIKSIDKLVSKCTPQVNFYDKDDISETFNFDLLSKEKSLFVDLMFETYFEQDLVKLRMLEEWFSDKDLKIFDTNAKKKIFLESLNKIKNENEKQIKNYASRDRITGKLKGLDYSGWDG